MDGLVLQRADQLEAGAVADVDEPPVGVPAERALRHLAVGRAIEHAAPALELADAVGRLLSVQLGHAPVVEVLAAEHRVLEVDLPVVGASTLPNDAAMPPSAITVCALPSSDLQTSAVRAPAADGRDRGSQPGAAGADHEHVVVVRSSDGISDDPRVVEDAARGRRT